MTMESCAQIAKCVYDGTPAPTPPPARGSTTTTTTPCNGRSCCCEANYGIVAGGDYQLELETGGSYQVQRTAQTRGGPISTNERVRDQCLTALQPAFVPARINAQSPCVLYMGTDDTAGRWASTGGTNFLEGLAGMQQIVGPTCADCPRVPAWCPNVGFPTMFWEASSYRWAQLIGESPQCGSTVFVLVPQIQNMPAGTTIASKISFRIEISSLKIRGNLPDFRLIFVGDTDCQTISRRLCTNAEVRENLAFFSYVGCLANWNLANVARLKAHDEDAQEMGC